MQQTTVDWGMQGWADFNKDGVSDIFWTNNNTGETAVWDLKADNLGATPFFNKGYTVQNIGINSGWIVEGVSDFNADGFNDIVWRNSNTNETVVWNMNLNQNQASIQTSYTFADTPSSAAWQLTSVVDINRDSTPDFIWSNYETSENAVWELKVELNGKTSLSKGYFLDSSTDANWRFGAIAYGDILN